MRMTVLAALGSLMLAGCGGQFVLYAPDPVAPAGQEAPMVVRLERLELFNAPAPVRETCVRFQATEGEQAAFTDKEGYAGVALRAPLRPGNYSLRVAVQAKEGEEVTQLGRFYVWAKEQRVIAVDLDSLPGVLSLQAAGGRAAMAHVAARANVLYLTQKPTSEHARAHRTLAQCGYPDGPILLWQSRRWEVVTRGGVPMPQILWEGRLVSQLPLLRKQFPGLTSGISTSSAAAAAFREAGIRPVIVGGAYVPDNSHLRCRTWADLASLGL